MEENLPVPWLGNFPTNIGERPDTTLIKKARPDELLPIVQELCNLKRFEARATTLSSVAQSHCNLACNWLNNRRPGEDGISIKTGPVKTKVKINRGWF